MPSLSPRHVVTVTVPARGAFVHVLRAVTASVAARMGIPYDGIEDLRLAVDEACGWLLGDEIGTTITLRLHPEDDRLEITVTTDAPRPWPPDGVEGTFTWRVLSALVDDVTVERDGAGPSIRLAKRTLEAPTDR